MRIVFASQEFPPDTARGGIGTQLAAKAHGMVRLGHDVRVISRSADGRRREYCEGDVAVTRLPGPKLSAHTEIADWIAYSAEVAGEIAALRERQPIDLLEFPEWACEAYVHLLNQTPWNRIPTAIHLHGPLVMFTHTMGWPEVDSEFYRTGTVMEATCLRLADAIYSSSRCSADWCAKHYGIDADNVPVIHTGVDTKLFRPLDVPKDDRPTIVFAGKLARNKGIFELLHVACRLSEQFPNLKLRMLGKGDANIAAELATLARRAGKMELLELAGFVDRRNLAAEFSRARVFAAPSIYEGGPGFVYLEAMACGLPVIACSGSGAAEVVRDGETGFLVKPNDIDGLVSVLRRLLIDPTGAAAIGRRARAYVLAEGDSEKCLKHLEAFYESAAQQGASTAAERGAS